MSRWMLHFSEAAYIASLCRKLMRYMSICSGFHKSIALCR